LLDHPTMVGARLGRAAEAPALVEHGRVDLVRAHVLAELVHLAERVAARAVVAVAAALEVLRGEVGAGVDALALDEQPGGLAGAEALAALAGLAEEGAGLRRVAAHARAVEVGVAEEEAARGIAAAAALLEELRGGAGVLGGAEPVRGQVAEVHAGA